jgi:hypothetical protein
MTEITEGDFKRTLDSHGGSACKSLMNDPKMFKATFDILKGLAASDTTSKVIAVASGVASGASTTAKYSSAASRTKEMISGTSMTLTGVSSPSDFEGRLSSFP